MSWMFNLTPNVTKKKTCLLSRHPSEVLSPKKLHQHRGRDGITSMTLGFIIEHYLSQHTNRKPLSLPPVPLCTLSSSPKLPPAFFKKKNF